LAGGSSARHRVVTVPAPLRNGPAYAGDVADEHASRTGNDPSGRTAGLESVFDSGLLPSPLGNDPSGTGPYDNSVVYLLCIFALLFAPLFGPIAVGVSGYRVVKDRPHAWRGVVVACAATGLGIWLYAALIGT
jgi:hypothetical protein